MENRIIKRILKIAEQRDWDGNLIEHLDEGIVFDNNYYKGPSPTEDSNFFLDKSMVISTFLSDHFDQSFVLDDMSVTNYDNNEKILDILDELGLLETYKKEIDVWIYRGTPIIKCIPGGPNGTKMTFDVGKGHTITTTLIMKWKYDKEKDLYLLS